MKENEKPNNPSAFPPSGFSLKQEQNSFYYEKGMTLRDYFAAKAMQAMISREHPNDGWSDSASSQAYFIADTMLKERTK